ncbi:YwgA family protein [Bacillus kwashiorkori]|uniref:YwgA family protein n=1 Tax=Bacillus kwashiorkori TaxID=1522318 RepID=UPI000780C3C6|nr:hypothetical protein [Bacillus kwashiorkori]
MLSEHAKILNTIRLADEVVGRKKLQKMIFIAKKLAYPFQEKFEFHFYGPYSEELTLQMEELVNMGFLEEVKEKKGGYFQYRYTITDTGEEFLQMYENALNTNSFDDLVQNLNDQSARFLELVSTILYFDQLSREEIFDKVYTVKSKQNYTEEEIEEAFRYIDALKSMANIQLHT